MTKPLKPFPKPKVRRKPPPRIALDPEALPGQIAQWARGFGFADAAVARLDVGADAAHLQDWLAAGFHGGMDYMARAPHTRATPAALRPGTLSVISLRMDSGPDLAEASARLTDAEGAYVARYALGRDYHKTLRGNLKALGRRIEEAIGPFGYRVLADSAPVLEKAFARNAGLGWIGKNTLLLDRHAGSFFLLAEIYTDLLLPPSARRARNHCGSCSACIDVCPTQAIVAPYRLDARRCISYLTIEHHGPIPVELRPLMGNRIFGCDDCQLVCPWNRYARRSALPDFDARHGLDAARLVELFAWDEPDWLARTEGMALRRAGHVNWLRNIAVALGNAPRSAEVVAALRSRVGHASEVVREHVAWALGRHGG